MQGITELNELMKNNANNDKGSLLEALERISRIARPETPGPVVDGGSDEEVVFVEERRGPGGNPGHQGRYGSQQGMVPPGSGQPGRSRTGRLGKAPRISSVNGTAGRHGGGFSGGHPAGGPGIGPTLGFGPGGFAVPGPSTGFGPGGFTGGFAVSGPLSGGPNRGFPIPGHSTSGPGGPRFAVPGQAFEGLQRGIGQVSGARGGQGSREQAAGGGGAPGNSSNHPSLNQDFNWAVPVNPMLPAPLPQSTMPSKHTEGMSSHQWWDDIPMPEDTPMMTRSIPGSSTEPSPQYDENHSVASVISQPGPSNPPMAPMTPGPVVITFERLNLNHSQPEPQPVLEEPECYCIEVNKPMPGVPQKLELRSDEVEMEEEEPEGGVTWCHVQTFQLGVKKKAQAKEVFQTSQPTFTIEGGITTVGSTSSRMQLTCGNSSKIQGIHQTFGEGIRMTKEKGTVWLTVLTAKCVVFIQSPFFNHINGKPLDTVIRVQNEHDELGNLLHEDKLPTIKLFDSELYASELNAARSDPINRMETMEAFCKTRVSLAKGFNGDYAKKIYDTQSWFVITIAEGMNAFDKFHRHFTSAQEIGSRS
ncbi:hypothetical protein L3Y34_005057 [Caenorhabditis briggsae]|uniref:MH2 domain-containing protein n=1 Tax=Caenorhabditis briggsae TaxID=6238 RepID=A0AAE9ADT3_CAEBR|nr:hypothetical protein L3Y34_005057 [Caenorhabditis briggsae]